MSFQSEKEFRNSIGIKDEVVYHYCSMDALYGIFTSRSLWLTSLESSNDTLELQLARKIINDALSQLIDNELDPELRLMFEKIQSAPQDCNYKKYRPKYKYYGLSLVKDKDSLTHWERYANNSTGVSIGINIALIEHMFLTNSIPDILSSWFQTTEIIYSNEDQVEFAKASIRAKIDGFQDMYRSIATVENIFSSIYYSTLTTLKPRFKHDGFSSEQEYRVYLEEGEAESTASYIKRNLAVVSEQQRELFSNLSNNILKLSNKLGILLKDKRYGLFGDGIRSFYNLNFEKTWSDVFIQEVVLGPKCYQNKKELKGFMKSCGLDRTKIVESKIPLR